MDPTTDLSTTAPAAAPTATAMATTAAAPAPQRRGGDHPLIWAALLVWLSVEAIGDGLLALQTVLSTGTASRRTTPTVTPS